MSRKADLPSVSERLGKPLEVFKSGGGDSRIPHIVLMLFGVFIFVLSGIGAVSGKAPPIIAVLAAAFAGLFGYFAFRKSEYAGWTVVLCERGLSSRDHRPTAGEKDHLRDITWDEIVSIRTSM